jgi:hypothetical protein
LGNGTIQLDLDLPWVKRNSLLLVIEMMAHVKSVPVKLLGSGKPNNKFKSLEAIEVASRPGSLPRIGHLTLSKGGPRYCRIAIGRIGYASPRVVRIRIYRLDKSGRNDYWVVAEPQLIQRKFKLTLGSPWRGPKICGPQNTSSLGNLPE